MVTVHTMSEENELCNCYLVGQTVCNTPKLLALLPRDGEPGSSSVCYEGPSSGRT